MKNLREEALSLFRAGDYEAAARAARGSLAEAPSDPELLSLLGVCLLKLNDFSAAAESLSESLRLAPGNAQAFFNCGLAFENLRRGDKAIELYQKALALNPSYVGPRNNLAGILCKIGELSMAMSLCKEGLALVPGSLELRRTYADVLNSMGLVKEAVDEYRKVVDACQGFTVALSDSLLCLLYMDGISNREIYERHLEWSLRYERPVLGAPPERLPSGPGRRLRVGYLSGDFKRHSVAFFIEPVLACHDKSLVETFCYSDTEGPDSITDRFKELAGNWREISSLSDEGVAEAIRADRIDILFDLAGHTGRRLRVFAMKPAPVQISWIGYPATTGLSSIDYRISDLQADPPGSEAFHSEKLLRLPGQFLVFSPPDDAPDLREAPCLRNGHVTFGSFNATQKITDSCVALWASAMKAVPGSKLILKNKGLRDEGVRRRLLGAFARAGVEEGRVRCLPFESKFASHLDVYSQVDIALDSYPYHGTTTTCEAFWMGVPTISLLGDRHCSRVALSLLGALGLPSLVVSSPAAFASLAQALSADLPRLASFKASLRGAMAASPLCDARTFVKAFEEELLRLCPL